MLKIESFYLNNKPFIFKSIFMISKKRRICFYEKENFCSFMAALITAISLSGCSRAETARRWPRAMRGKARLKRIQEEVDEIVFAYFTQNNIPETSELQRIEDLLNEYTVEKINTKVHLALFSNARLYESG